MMINLNPEYVQALKDIGVPADRMELVKRNIQLKGTVEFLTRLVETIMATLHEAHDHPGSPTICTKPTCTSMREALEMAKAGI